MRDLKFPGDDRKSVASGGSGTPNAVQRRRIIDKNVKVNGAADLNASELIRECEAEYPRLNYSYNNVSTGTCQGMATKQFLSFFFRIF